MSVGQRHLKTFRQFVVLQYINGIDHGKRFWTTAEPTGGDNTWSHGPLSGGYRRSYREILFTDDTKVAIAACSGHSEDDARIAARRSGRRYRLWE